MQLLHRLGDLVHHVGAGKPRQVKQAVQLQSVASLRGNAGQVAVFLVVGKAEFLAEACIECIERIQSRMKIEPVVEDMRHEVFFLIHHEEDILLLRNHDIAAALAGGHAGGELLAGEQGAPLPVAQFAHLGAERRLEAPDSLDDREQNLCCGRAGFFRTPAGEGVIRQIPHHAHDAAAHHTIGRVAVRIPRHRRVNQRFEFHASWVGRELIWSRSVAARS